MLKNLFFFSLLLQFVNSVDAQVEVLDGLNKTLILEQPAVRIISLSPHITELLYAAGATDQIVAVVNYSDYPEQAKKLPQVGSSSKFDLESIIALKPDLIIAWKSGNPHEQLKSIENLGYKIFYSEPRSLEDVAKELRQMGVLLNTQKTANKVAKDFLSGIKQLRKKYSHKEKVSVFYQVWNQPLFTVNDKHIISRVINLCGGINVFGSLSVLSPRVSIESVIEKNPDAIVVGMAKSRRQWINEWKKWRVIKAVKNENIFPINADLIVRHTPRILQGAKKMCAALDTLRNN